MEDSHSQTNYLLLVLLRYISRTNIWKQKLCDILDISLFKIYMALLYFLNFVYLVIFGCAGSLLLLTSFL